MTRKFLLLGLGLCLVAGIARADEQASAELAAELLQFQHLQGQFLQRQYAASGGELVGETRGNFRLLRPGYFAWEITVPDSQLIIADLEHLWHFDRDLETVTRRPVTGREDMSPLQVLGGDTDVLAKNYTVEKVGAGRYQLVPLPDTNPGFESLVVILASGQFSGMEIHDKLGQRLFIEFSEVDDQTTLTPADFAFTPPAGADLFYHDQ
jgi:outer membrane lipoprotein carrier protein